ncbi:unnamed protein product, partial [marine sediment metagenome]
CVHTWANSAYANNVQFGDNLADYVDAGGTVVLGVFCTYTPGNYLSGRIMTSGYCPVVSPTGTNHTSLSSYAGDGTTCIHNGITNYDCVYRDYLQLQGSGIQDGSYVDGEIAHAYRPDFKVIYSNGSGCSVIGGGGQWPELICNACSCQPIPGHWQVVADDYRCIDHMPVTSIHWWGSHYGWEELGVRPPQLPIGWKFCFWSNVPASPSNDGPLSSGSPSSMAGETRAVTSAKLPPSDQATPRGLSAPRTAVGGDNEGVSELLLDCPPDTLFG